MPGVGFSVCDVSPELVNSDATRLEALRSSIWERALLGVLVPRPPITALPPAFPSLEPAPRTGAPPLTQWAPPTGTTSPHTPLYAAPYPHLLASPPIRTASRPFVLSGGLQHVNSLLDSIHSASIAVSLI